MSKFAKVELLTTTSDQIEAGDCIAAIASDVSRNGAPVLIMVNAKKRNRSYVSTAIAENRVTGLLTRMIKTSAGSEHKLRFQNPVEMLAFHI